MLNMNELKQIENYLIELYAKKINELDKYKERINELNETNDKRHINYYEKKINEMSEEIEDINKLISKLFKERIGE